GLGRVWAWMPPLAYNTLQDVVHWQILEGKTGAAKRGFFPALSSRLTFPLVARMPWRGLCVRSCVRCAKSAAPVSHVALGSFLTSRWAFVRCPRKLFSS